MIRAVAFNSSPRKGGNTETLLKAALKEIEAEGIQTELVQIGAESIRGCIACYGCFERKDCKCVMSNDVLNDCVFKMLGADAIILGSPVYVGDVSSTLRALIERACVVSRANGGIFRRKVGAGVVAVRRAGATNALDSVNRFFAAQEMFIAGASYWNLGVGRNPGDVEGDEEGMRTMKSLGANIAWLLKRIRA